MHCSRRTAGAGIGTFGGEIVKIGGLGMGVLVQKGRILRVQIRVFEQGSRGVASEKYMGVGMDISLGGCNRIFGFVEINAAVLHP